MARIAVDAMGGDNAPREVVEGAILASADGVDVVLVGDEAAIAEVIADRTVDERVAYVVADMLRDVVRRGTGRRARSAPRRTSAHPSACAVFGSDSPAGPEGR